MNYQETLNWLFAQLPMYQREGQAAYKANLDNTLQLDEYFRHPHKNFKTIHVAGTNGKGSVSHMLASILQQAGYKTGLYTSPHLKDFRERIKINGEMVSEQYVIDFVRHHADLFSRVKPSFFEMTVAMAFKYFADSQVDIAVIEVGLGGRLDSTNIITPLASVITNISFDHMALLGNTLEKIASEKAGIIKENSHVVTALQKKEAMDVICSQCEKCHAECVVADPGKAQVLAESCLGQTLLYEGEKYEIPLAGVYQKENAVVALNALKVLDTLGFASTPEQKKAGMKHTVWNGRFTVLCTEPLFVVDGAHNPAAADMMAASIEHYFKGKRLIYIMGVFGDKDYRSVVAKTVPYADKILTIQTPNNERALPAAKLAETVKEFHKDVQARESIEQAVETAFRLAHKEDVILAFGSLSFIGEMTDLVEKEKKREGKQK